MSTSITTTVQSAQQANLDYYSSRWNGSDLPGTGTALTGDFIILTVNGSRDVTSYKNSEDSQGVFSTENQTYEVSDGYDSSGKKLPVYIESQNDGGHVIDAGLLYDNPSLKSNSPLSGMGMIDAGLIELLWPLQYVNKYYGTNAPTDTSVGTGKHLPTIVTATDPCFGGFPQQLTYPQTVVGSSYTNPKHDQIFYLKDAMPALYRLLISPYNTQTPSPRLTATGYKTYNSAALFVIREAVGICRTLLYGGTTNFSTSAPFSDGSGGYIGGPYKVLYDGWDLQTGTHRLWTTASALQSTYIAATQAGLTGVGDLLWWSRQYAQQAIQNQVQSPLTNKYGLQYNLDLTGYYPEQISQDNVGFDLSYGATSLDYAITYYLECPDRSFADSLVLPSILQAAACYASRVLSDGTVNLWGCTRCNPYRDPVSGAVLGQPIIPLGTTPQTWAYTGENDSVTSNVGNPKAPAYTTLAEAFLRLGTLLKSLTGSDTSRYMQLGALINLKQNFTFISPSAVVSTVLPSQLTPRTSKGTWVGPS